jgi:hypothetical protein
VFPKDVTGFLVKLDLLLASGNARGIMTSVEGFEIFSWVVENGHNSRPDFTSLSW